VWNQEGGLLGGSVDAGALIGKPLAAGGEMVGETVGQLVKSVSALHGSLTEVEYQKAMAFAQQGDDQGLLQLLKQIGIDAKEAGILPFTGGGATATDEYMKRNSPSNWNKYYNK